MELLRDKRDELDKVAELLLEKEVIGHEDMLSLVGARPAGSPEMSYAALAMAEGLTELDDEAEAEAEADTDTEAASEEAEAKPAAKAEA